MSEIVIPPNPNATGPGVFIAMLDGKPEPIEDWVQMLSRETGEVLDWRYMGGRAMVTYYGPPEKRHDVTKFAAEQADKLNAKVMEIIRP